MQRHPRGNAFLLGIVLVLGGCDPGESLRGPRELADVSDVSIQDQQFLKILHQHSFRDTVDTFNGRLVKDLILDGTVSIRFWLTRAEQESVRAQLERERFFTMPDTLFSIPGMFMSPNPGPDFLCVETDGAEKTVVWFFPLDQTVPANQAILRVSATIRRIVESRREYKELPEPRGGYI